MSGQFDNWKTRTDREGEDDMPPCPSIHCGCPECLLARGIDPEEARVRVMAAFEALLHASLHR